PSLEYGKTNRLSETRRRCRKSDSAQIVIQDVRLIRARNRRQRDERKHIERPDHWIRIKISPDNRRSRSVQDDWAKLENSLRGIQARIHMNIHHSNWRPVHFNISCYRDSSLLIDYNLSSRQLHDLDPTQRIAAENRISMSSCFPMNHKRL